MNSVDLQLFYHPAGRLRLTIPGDRSYIAVRPAWAAPLSRPGQYLALLDGNGKEIITLPDPAVLPPDSFEAVQRELRFRYLTATVLQVESARQEYGATYWTMQTNRGPRDFVTQNLQENATWLSDTHLLLLDVDGNRFEIPDIAALDKKSRDILDEIL